MPEFISYPKIGQFRNTVGHFKKGVFSHLDETTDPPTPIYKEPPVVEFHGTIKTHGTNSAVVQGPDGEIWFQSRKNIITPERDNAGFAMAQSSSSKLEQWDNAFKMVKTLPFNFDNTTVAIFGEWIGSGIQKGVGVSQLSKRMIVFGIKIVFHESGLTHWANYNLWEDFKFPVEDVYNVHEFPTYTVIVDFKDPFHAQNKFVELVADVEKECPVSKAFDVDGIGEGIVWTGLVCEGKDINIHRFKTKGEKHSVSKVKTVAPVDIEKMNKIKDFIDYAVTENRLNQGIEMVFTTQGVEPDIKKTGDYLRWLRDDVITEETDTISENGWSVREMNGPISKAGKEWFMNYLNERVGL